MNSDSNSDVNELMTGKSNQQRNPANKVILQGLINGDLTVTDSTKLAFEKEYGDTPEEDILEDDSLENLLSDMFEMFQDEIEEDSTDVSYGLDMESHLVAHAGDDEQH